MKKVAYTLFLFVFFTSLTSCHTKNKDHLAMIEYQCPMKCEGDKIFDEPGNCAVCKMDLQPLKTKIKETDEISDLSVYNLPSK